MSLGKLRAYYLHSVFRQARLVQENATDVPQCDSILAVPTLAMMLGSTVNSGIIYIYLIFACLTVGLVRLVSSFIHIFFWQGLVHCHPASGTMMGKYFRPGTNRFLACGLVFKLALAGTSAPLGPCACHKAGAAREWPNRTDGKHHFDFAIGVGSAPAGTITW